MTTRERFRAVLAGDPAVDRCPVMEWATWWNKTLDFWEGEGMPRGLSGQEVFDFFGLDTHIQFWFSTRTPECPAKAYHGAPLIRDLDDYRELRKFILPGDAVRKLSARIEKALPRYRAGDAVFWYTLEGFFWFPRELFGIEPHLYAFYDQEDLYRRICEDLLAWQLAVVEEFSRYLRADFMTIAEDMSYNKGSMISEEIFEAFVAPYYRMLIPEIKKYGTRVFVDSDGDVSNSVPWYIRAGVEGILPLERQAGVDIGALQDRYPEFCWFGGFDKMCLLQDAAAVDAEIERIVPMLRKGRFIPSVDHQTPPGVKMALYRYYLERLRAVSGQACRDAV